MHGGMEGWIKKSTDKTAVAKTGIYEPVDL